MDVLAAASPEDEEAQLEAGVAVIKVGMRSKQIEADMHPEVRIAGVLIHKRLSSLLEEETREREMTVRQMMLTRASDSEEKRARLERH